MSQIRILLSKINWKPKGLYCKRQHFCEENGIELKDAKIEADDTGFVIQTGASLSDMDKIEVCYEVVFKTESTEPEKL